MLKIVGLIVDRRDVRWVRHRRNPALNPRVVVGCGILAVGFLFNALFAG